MMPMATGRLPDGQIYKGMDNMKASYMEKQGGPEVLKYGDLPDPAAGRGEVVVDIHAASVNGADWKVRAGHYSEMTEFPYVLGRDFPAWSARLARASMTLWSAMRCLAFAMSARKAHMPRRSP